MGAAPVVCKVVEVKENQQIELYEQNRGRSNQYASCELENVTLFCLAAEQHKAPCNHARPTWSRNNNAAGAKAHNQENFTMNKNLKPSKAVEMGSSSCSGKENFQGYPLPWQQLLRTFVRWKMQNQMPQAFADRQPRPCTDR